MSTNHPISCEDCVFFDEVDEYGTMDCTLNLDQDEVYQATVQNQNSCRYYRPYDEYKSVQKQN